VPTELGDLIAQARTATGVPAVHVARAAGIDSTVYSRIESGEIASPSFASIAGIARVLGLDLNLVAQSLVSPASDTARNDLQAYRELESLRGQLNQALQTVETILRSRRVTETPAD
jgi:transcriptional regulator with XRE-family HTH domain